MQLNPQRGGTLMGFILGLVIGLGVALAVAVYVTKVPTPFSNKNQTRSNDQDAKENEKNKDWNPNSVLQAKPPAEVPGTPSKPAAEPGAEKAATPNATPNTTAAPAATNAPAPAPAKADAKVEPRPAVTADPLMDLAKAKSALSTPADATSGADPFEYVIQVGAFRTNADADNQKAKLAAMGLDAKVSERDQAGRSVFRVRLGPFADKAAAEKVRTRLESSSIENTLVRVQR
jgi:cell division protein FtsN